MGNSKIADYIDKVTIAINSLKKKHKDIYANEQMFAYRGESKDFGKTKLMPSIFRNKDNLDKENYLFELLCDYKFVDKNATSIEKAIEAQHYIAISRMLDITFNILNALYFACEFEPKDDGIIYVFGFPNHYSPSSDYILNYYERILEGEEKSYSRNFKVFSHSYSNDRIKAQKGGFIFFPGDDFYAINECYYESILVKAEDKIVILEELELLFDINKLYIYPEKNNVIDTIKSRFHKNNLYEKNTNTIESEVKVYFDRLLYEINLSLNDILTTKRFLRKEKYDISEYINASDFDEKERLLSYINQEFKMIEIMLGEQR